MYTSTRYLLSIVSIGRGWALNHTLEQIKEDLVVQEKFIQLDNQCLEVRKKLSEHPSTKQLPTLVTSNKGE